MKIIVMDVIKKSTRINIHKFVPLIKQNVRSKGRKQLINPDAAAAAAFCLPGNRAAACTGPKFSANFPAEPVLPLRKR